MPPTRSDCPSLLAALTGSAVATAVDAADDPAADAEAFFPVDVGSGSSVSLSPLRCAETTTRPTCTKRYQTGADHHPVGDVERHEVDLGDRLGVGTREEADPKGHHRPEPADHGDAERRHGQREDGSEGADPDAAEEDLRLRPALVASLNGLRGSDAQGPRPTGREGRGVEHPVEEPGIQQHRRGDADEHRHDHARLPEEERYADRQEEAVGRTERR
ncbi:MAG TPA: hypothetical protein PK132_14960 [Dermatophilaceae bacterium]|nr:hypothetical protein [Dermatophilaceae bacterium]